MLLFLAMAFGALVYAPLVTVVVLRLQAENELLRAEHDRLGAENETLRAENAALACAFERRGLEALATGAVPPVPGMLKPTERLAYWFALRQSARGTPSGEA